jgi:cysteine synthase
MTHACGFSRSVGNTPLIRLNTFSAETDCDVLGKAEFLYPGGSVRYVYRLLREEGLFLGITRGINVAAAVELAHRLGPGHRIVTVLCDGGSKYLSRLFNDAWLEQKGLLRFANNRQTKGNDGWGRTRVA